MSFARFEMRDDWPVSHANINPVHVPNRTAGPSQTPIAPPVANGTILILSITAADEPTSRRDEKLATWRSGDSTRSSGGVDPDC